MSAARGADVSDPGTARLRGSGLLASWHCMATVACLMPAFVYRPFPDIACCHGSHHFRTIGSMVAGKKPALAGVLASDVDLSLWYLHGSVRPQFPVVSSLIFLALERTGMEDGITVDVILASCANYEDEGEVDRIGKRPSAPWLT